jgi:hypothetical protein
MAFVTLGEHVNSLTYIDPERIDAYTVDEVATGCFMVRLMVGSWSHTLANPEEEHRGFPTQEAATEYLEAWLTSIMAGVAELKKNRFRVPVVGDIFRILDNYWEVTAREPGLTHPISVLLDENLEFNKKPYRAATRSQSRLADWFDENAEFVGNREDIEQGIAALAGTDTPPSSNIQHFLDGFTGREEIVVHYGDATSRDVYCCGREYGNASGNVFTDDLDRVTCPEFKPVVHYAMARDNQVRCCGVKYPLDKQSTWSEYPSEVTCTAFTRNVAVQTKRCDSKEVHRAHDWKDDETNYVCVGVMGPPMDYSLGLVSSPVDSEHDA